MNTVEAFACWTMVGLTALAGPSCLANPAESTHRVIEGRVTCCDGQPVAAARLRCHTVEIEFATPHPPCASVITGPDGRFRLEPLPATATVKIIVSERSFATWEAVLRPEDGDTVEIPLLRSTTVRGTVRSPTGKAIADVDVIVARRAGETAKVIHAPKRFRRRSNSQGEFSITGLGPGTYSIFLMSGNHPPLFLPLLELRQSQPEGLDLGDLQLAAETSFPGRLLDSAGEPIAGIPVGWRLRTEDESAEARIRQYQATVIRPPIVSDADGRFEIRGLVAGDTFVFFVDEPRFVRHRSEHAVAAQPSEHSLELRLFSSATISGQVFDQAGRPLPGAEFRLASSNPYPRTRSQSDGSFRLTQVPPGDQLLIVASPQARQELPLTVRPGEERSVDTLRLAQELSTVALRTVDADGNGLSGTKVQPDHNCVSEWASKFYYTDSEGRLEWSDLPVGCELSLFVRHEKHGFLKTKLVVGAEPEEHLIRVTPPRWLHLVVRDPEGQPVPLAKVVLWEGKNGRSAAKTFPSGKIRFQVDDPSALHLQVDHPDFAPYGRDLQPSPESWSRVQLIELERGFRISGNLSRSDGKPLPEQVSAFAKGGRKRSVRVDADGKYDLGALSPGLWFVKAHTNHQVEVCREIEVEAATAEATVDIRIGTTDRRRFLTRLDTRDCYGGVVKLSDQSQR